MMVWGALVGSSQQVPSNPSTLYDDLVAYWKLGEASGTRADSVGSNNLTDNNTVTQAAGKVGNAASFAAANSEWLSIADNADLSMGDIDFTIAGWFSLTSKPAATTAIVYKMDDTATVREYGSGWNWAADRLEFNVSATNSTWDGVVTATTLGSPSTATWYFVVMWHNAAADTLNIQVNNGTVDSAAYSSGVQDGNAPFNLGSYGDGAGAFHDGLIDELGIWKRVLTAAERTELYNGGSGKALY